ncbi:MAG: acyl-CoA dehydrogenase family protein [Chloroflexota bacterium]
MKDGVTQAFLVPAETPGLVVDRRDKLMGVRAMPSYMITMQECRIPAANRLGGDAGSDPKVLINHSRVALRAAAVGARAGFEYARDYAQQLVQFGEPIAHRQSIAFMLADMATEIDEARLLVWETAWLLDQARTQPRKQRL